MAFQVINSYINRYINNDHLKFVNHASFFILTISIPYFFGIAQIGSFSTEWLSFLLGGFTFLSLYLFNLTSISGFKAETFFHHKYLRILLACVSTFILLRTLVLVGLHSYELLKNGAAYFTVSVICFFLFLSVITTPCYRVASTIFSPWNLIRNWMKVFGLFNLSASFLIAYIFIGFQNFVTFVGNARPWTEYAPILIVLTLVFIEQLSPLPVAPFYRRIVGAIAVITGALQASRTDVLTYDVHAFHLEYFLGPLRSFKSGLIPLYDIPSQYGLLNILISSIFPGNNVVDQFGFFHSTLLFITFIILTYCYSISSSRQHLLLSILCASALFWADPSLIGPWPFPSSSVVRFFPVYLMLLSLCSYCFDRISKTSFQQSLIGVVIFCFFWSSEGFAYAFVPSFACLFYVSVFPKLSKFGLLSFYKAVLSLVVVFFSVFSVFSIFYFSKYGLFPNWRIMTEYAIEYRKGFGALPLDLGGVVWLPILVMAVASFNSFRFLLDKEEKKSLLNFGVFWVVWILTSYFVGRAHANNIMAIFPIYLLVLHIIIVSSIESVRVVPQKLFWAIFLSVFVHLLSQNGFKRFSEIYFVKPVLPSFYNRNEEELQDLMNRHSIRHNDRIVYFGLSPKKIVTYEATWFSNPLTMLGTPIDVKRREELVRITREKNPYSGWLLGEAGSKADIDHWVELFSQHYKVELREVTHGWILYWVTP